MAVLTVEFSGVLEDVLSALVKRGFAKTKTEALRMALLHYGEEFRLVQGRLHAKAEEYAYAELRKR